MRVTLTWVELLAAATEGVRRQTENLQKGRQDRYGRTQGPHDWTTHVEAAAAEMAVAKGLGRYWSGANGVLRGADGDGYEVRSTQVASGCLLLHPPDDDDLPFVLAVGVAPSFLLAGWVYGREGKRDEWWDDPRGNRPCYFVPQRNLRPMCDLEV